MLRHATWKKVMRISASLTSAKWGFAWLALVGCAVAVVASFSRDDAIRANILELLPGELAQETVGGVARELAQAAAERLIFVVGHAESGAAMEAAALLAERLAASDGIRGVTHELEIADAQPLLDFYAAARDRALTPAQVEAILEDGGRRVADIALAQMFGPASPGDGARIESDPFFLFADAMRSRLPSFGRFAPRGGPLVAEADGASWVLVTAQLHGDALEPRRQRAIANEVGRIETELERRWPGIELRRAGVLFYNEAGTRAAQGDVSLIGTGSVAGIMLLLLATFRSTRPLLMAILSTAAGITCGIAATLLAFGSIHVLTLVFGAGLIGVAIDYTFHYVTEERFGSSARPADILANIAPAMTLGGLTSMAAYGALLFSPFPGLRQVAVFSVAGLAGALFTVFAVFPRWRAPDAAQPMPLLGRIAARFLAAAQGMERRTRVAILGAALALASAGLAIVSFDDDVRRLQARPAELVADEAFLSELVGNMPSTSFILVQGATPDEVLEREEALREELDRLRARGELGAYSAVSQWVPSRATQARSAEAYRALARVHLEPLLSMIGFDQEDAVAIRDRTVARISPPLEIEDWLETATGAEARALWLGETGGAYRSVVLLRGAGDARGLELLAARDYFTYYDQASRLTEIFRAYRSQVKYALGLALLVAAGGFSLALGWRVASRILFVPALAACIALSAAYLVTGPLSLFSIAALFVVLGVGVDFSLFVALRRGGAAVVMLAVTLSMLTTLMSFGLLSFSSTSAVSSFGFTVLIGILSCYLLTPLVVRAPCEAPA